MKLSAKTGKQWRDFVITSDDRPTDIYERTNNRYRAMGAKKEKTDNLSKLGKLVWG